MTLFRKGPSFAVTAWTIRIDFSPLRRGGLIRNKKEKLLVQSLLPALKKPHR
jgi:hypothetical protein